MSGHEVTITPKQSMGWVVALSGTGINLALGILYTWSVISKGIPAEWGWNESDKSWPYSIACLVFCIVMVPAGRMQDKIGPKITASIGGVLVGLGMIVASLGTTLFLYILGFGVLAGAGFGFGYASATPPAVKWFHSSRTGLIAGIVVSGFGLASVYAAPVSNWLITTYSLQRAMMILGGAFLVIVVGLSQFLRIPPAGYTPVAPKTAAKKSAPKSGIRDYTPSEMLKTPQFFILWFMYACGAGAGLMVIAKLAAIVKVQAAVDLGFVLVAVLAIGNGMGRIGAGVLSDRLGRVNTMRICFVVQACMVILLSLAVSGSALATIPVLVFISAMIGANYGANLSLFPSITKDFYGMKNFGVNYGLVFTAWGVGGFMLAMGAGKLYDLYKSFSYAYYGAAILLVIAAACTFLVKPPKSA